MPFIIDQNTAASLSEIVLRSVYGADVAAQQTLRKAVSQGDMWLIVGSINNSTHHGLKNCVFHLFISKTNAEVRGIGFNASFVTDAASEQKWRLTAPSQQVTAWSKGTPLLPSSGEVELASVLAGGVINNADDALAFAKAILKNTFDNQALSRLSITERAGSWQASVAGADTSKPLLVISRETGATTLTD